MTTEATAEPTQVTDNVLNVDNASPAPEAEKSTADNLNLSEKGTTEQIDQASEEKIEESQEAETPIEYTLALPEDSLIDDAALNAVKEFAEQHKLPNDVAQEILNQRNEAVRSALHAEVGKWDEQTDGWKKEIATDKEIGGDHLEETKVLFTQAIRKFFPEDFIQQLEDSKMLYNPHLVRGFRDIGKAMQNDRFVPGGSAHVVDSDTSADARAKRMFGNIQR